MIVKMLLPSLSLLMLLAVCGCGAKTVPQPAGVQREKQTGEMERPQAKGAAPLDLSIQVIQSQGFNSAEEEEESVLDLERQHRRAPRGAEEEDTGEQQSTFSHSYENDFSPTPTATQLSNATLALEAGDQGNQGDQGNSSSSTTERGVTRIHNPLYPVTDSSYSAYGVMFLSLVVFAVGVVGNLAVMCIVWQNYYMRSAWNYILASVAFWDFLVLCFCLPVVVFNELTNKRLLGDISCRMVPYMEVTSLGITSFSLCALGIDRFVAATSSKLVIARRVERCRSVFAKLLVIWLISMVLASPELLLWQLSQAMSPVTGTLVDSCTINPSSAPSSTLIPDSVYTLLLQYHDARMWWYFGCYFCLPVVFTLLCQLATCNVSGDTASRDADADHDHGRSTSSPAKKHGQQVERHLNVTVMALAVVYGICALPENVMNIALAYTATPISANTAALLALINHFLLFFKSSVTPVLLLCLCKSLGQAFMDCCCCCCEECHQSSPSPTHHPGSSPSHAAAQAKLKSTNEMSSSSIFFDKAKDSSTILAISTGS